MKLWSNRSVARPTGGFNPERRLLAAVLQRAITDFLSGEGELHASAKEWMYNDEEQHEAFCFHYICEALDFHKEELRKAVMRQYERQVQNGSFIQESDVVGDLSSVSSLVAA